MTTTIANEWLTLVETIEGVITPVTRNGLIVQRKYAGINSLCDENNVILHNILSYYERELYPNGEQNKIALKSYSIIDLEKQEWIETQAVINEEGIEITPAVIKYRNELLCLTGFLASWGVDKIVTPVRDTLINLAKLPLNIEDKYPLHRDTRTIYTL
jgi:hypothetical protein